MQNQLTCTLQKRWPMVIIIALLLVVVACSSDSNKDSAGVASLDSGTNAGTESVSSTSVPLTETDTVLAGQLAIVRGSTLEVLTLDGSSEPVALIEDVNAPTLQLLSMAERIFFTAGSPRKRLHELVLSNPPSASQVVRVPSEFSTPISISPDAEWVVVTGFPTTDVGRTDGSNERYTLVNQGEFGITFWLEDNRILVIKNDQANPQQFSATIFNPADRDATETVETTIVGDMLALTLNSETPTDIVRFNDLVVQNFGVALAYVPQSEEDVAPQLDLEAPASLGSGAFTGDVPLCEPWELRRILPDGTVESLYSVPDALFLDNPYAAEDGTVFVEHWYLADCDPEQRFVDLIRINPDGTTEVLIADMNPSSGFSYGSWLIRVANRTQLSPDGELIAWLDGSEDEGYTSVNIHILATGQNIEIARTELSGTNLPTFFEREALKAVQWLPVT